LDKLKKAFSKTSLSSRLASQRKGNTEGDDFDNEGSARVKLEVIKQMVAEGEHLLDYDDCSRTQSRELLRAQSVVDLADKVLSIQSFDL
jgi:hypothetical protein